MTDLVVISLESWDGVWRRNQHLIWRMLHADPALRVLFVEPPADPAHELRSGRRPRRGRGLDDSTLAGRLWTMRPLKLLPRRLGDRADASITQQVVRAARRLGMDDPILWVNDPGGAEISRRTGWRTLYDMTDDWLAADRPAGQLDRVATHERFLLADADQVVACSAELQRRKSAQRPSDRDPVALIRNAVDAEAYRRPSPRPADLPSGPIVLYVGTLHEDRLDIALCETLARDLGDRGSLVLVGPNALASAASVNLRDAGVTLLGPRPHDNVVAYLQHADVLVVPHAVTPFTDSLDPIKLYEYQAVGRPVVSTAVAGFRDAEDDRIVIADRAGFTDAVIAALRAAKPFPAGADRAVADWNDRADAMLGILASMARPKSP
ncbi:Glycosyltransferase involved in cell wall bisynthesis [Microbacterium sp. cf046]|uniref:glycosyltransferase n=1 Tax=Microbacterium sp. cf046 TaxID=1761803 RepID=UPI0008EC5BE2|nr:glycosyltransferase [Microbacterium sp. cf046]SFR90989.1 Glycosyltransferase involved in cell wall bisynthesis [Microbacterium sp. cf046]